MGALRHDICHSAGLTEENLRVDAHHSVAETAELVRRSCAVRPVVAIASETGRRRAVATTSCELAEQILSAGRSVAVVDCDFHAPVLHQFWHRATSPGLSSVLVGVRSIDDVFDYRALPTGRFLTVTAGEDSARRAHLFESSVAEQAIRRLVDFAEIVLVNIGPLSEPGARSAVALCDAVVMVAPVGDVESPSSLHGLRTPIIAWTPDFVSTPEEVHGRPATPEPISDLVPAWIDAAVTTTDSAPSVGGAPAQAQPLSVAEPTPVPAPPEPVSHAPAVAGVADPARAVEAAPSARAPTIVDAAHNVAAPATSNGVDAAAPATSNGIDAAARPGADRVDADDFDVDHLWEPATPVVTGRVPGSTGAPASESALADASLRKRRKKKYRARMRYLP